MIFRLSPEVFTAGPFLSSLRLFCPLTPFSFRNLQSTRLPRSADGRAGGRAKLGQPGREAAAGHGIRVNSVYSPGACECGFPCPLNSLFLVVCRWLPDLTSTAYNLGMHVACHGEHFRLWRLIQSSAPLRFCFIELMLYSADGQKWGGGG